MHLKFLALENFQSHHKTLLEFHPNFNCIIGLSRVGKSSVVRALQFIFSNDWIDEYVRIGAKSSKIVASYSNNCSVERIKGDGKNVCSLITPLEKKTFTSFGKDIPLEIKETFQIHPLEIDSDTSILLSVADQDDDAFLLRSSSANRSKVLGSLSGVHVIDQALRALVADKKKLSFEKENLNKTNEKLLNELKNLPNFDEFEIHLKKAKEEFLSIESNSILLKELKDLLFQLELIEKVAGDLENKLNCLGSIDFSCVEKIYCDSLRLNELKDISHKVNGLNQKIEQSEESLHIQRIKVEEEHSNLVSTLKELKRCPTCFSELNDPKILEITGETV